MDYQATGFRNTSEVTISNSEEAVQRAAEELGFSNPHGYAYNDETCGYWMVEIYDNVGYEDLTYYEYRDKLIRNTQTVIIDDRGITKEIYNHITISSVFIGLPE